MSVKISLLSLITLPTIHIVSTFQNISFSWWSHSRRKTTRKPFKFSLLYRLHMTWLLCIHGGKQPPTNSATKTLNISTFWHSGHWDISRTPWSNRRSTPACETHIKLLYQDDINLFTLVVMLLCKKVSCFDYIKWRSKIILSNYGPIVYVFAHIIHIYICIYMM